MVSPLREILDWRDEWQVQNCELAGLATLNENSLLDFGFCHAIRTCLAGGDPSGFRGIQDLFDLDGNCNGATGLATFFENSEMPRFQSLGAPDRTMDLAFVLLLTSRGAPCFHYGCEQYLPNDTDGGGDPYNRPTMSTWDKTDATRLVSIIANERKTKPRGAVGGTVAEMGRRRCLFICEYTVISGASSSSTKAESARSRSETSNSPMAATSACSAAVKCDC